MLCQVFEAIRSVYRRSGVFLPETVRLSLKQPRADPNDRCAFLDSDCEILTSPH